MRRCNRSRVARAAGRLADLLADHAGLVKAVALLLIQGGAAALIAHTHGWALAVGVWALVNCATDFPRGRD